VANGTALITGASSGIGAELAILCATAGYNVILVARSESRLTTLAARLRTERHIEARIVAADLADPASPDAIFVATADEPIDILINNAGFGIVGAFAESDWTAQAALMQVNMTAPVRLTRLFLPGMIARRKGRILNVASTAAFVPGPFMALYYASKAFLLSFSHAVANEVQGTGVTITALCPGPTATEFAKTAGNAESPLFKGPVMSAADVAREGFGAMMAGKPEVIAGTRNRWMMRGARLLPLSRLARTTRRLNLGKS
jgi:short-subunit dehydrogenase